MKLKEIASFIVHNNFPCKTRVQTATVACGYDKANDLWINGSRDVVRRGCNELNAGRHTPVKNCMQHMTQYGQYKNRDHACTDATCIQTFIISVNYIQQITKNFSLPRRMKCITWVWQRGYATAWAWTSILEDIPFRFEICTHQWEVLHTSAGPCLQWCTFTCSY